MGNISGLLALAVFSCSLLGNFHSDQAFAQVPQVGETVEERQYSRSREQIRNFENDIEQAPRGLALPSLQTEELTQKSGDCVKVDSIEISNLRKYSSTEFDEFVSPLEGTCLYSADINNILRHITNRYIEDGYVTSRAVLAEQDLTDGTLDIAIVEGHVEGLQAVEDAFSPRELAFAFPIRTNKHLNLRDIEQGIDQLARLPSNNPTTDIKAGEQQGGSFILIKDTSEARPFRGSVSIDNSGQSSTGVGLLSSSISVDNILGINDLWSVSGNTNLDGGENSGSRGLNGFLSIPYGYFSTSFSGGYFEFESVIPGFAGDIENDGTSWFANASLDWLIYRDATRKFSLTSGIGITDNDNFVNDIRLLASSFRLTTINLGVDYQERIWGGLASASLFWRQGTNLLGAESITTGDDGPQRIFNKLEFDFRFNRPFRIKKGSFNYSAVINGQFSDRNLFSAERISVGSTSAVRGFRSGGISGDEGAYLRQDITWFGLCCEINSGWLQGEVDMSLFVGYDVGQIKRDEQDDFERGLLKSVTIGTRMNIKNVLLSLSLSHGIDSPSFVNRDNVELNASASVRF